MAKKIIIFITIFLFGLASGYFLYTGLYREEAKEIINKVSNELKINKNRKEVIGFLPYWLLSKADKDYSKYLTTLTYFSLTVGEDGKIEQYTNPGESEPGYLTLKRGKADKSLNDARKNGLSLSLAVFCADDEKITKLLENPRESAKNLTDDVIPIMKEYAFDDLNLDIEQVADASPGARLKFTEFVKSVKNNLDEEDDIALSIDVYASSFVKDTNLYDPKIITPMVDKVIIMAYDYHHIGSFVTGPVAPGEGGGIVSEYDIQTAVKTALNVVPKEKIILGIPLYGYEWETIRDVPRSAIIPGTGLTISNRRAEELLSSCASCSAVFDEYDKENYIIYKNEVTGNYHQAFYPDIKSTQYKIDVALNNSLGGLALWALGYEGNSILEPLSSYRD